MKSRRFAAALVIAAAVGCSSGIIQKQFKAFDTRFPDNDNAQVAAVVARLATTTDDAASYFANSLGRPMVVGVKSGQQQSVFAFLVDEGKILWEKPFQPASRPTLIDDLVLFRFQQSVVALDAKTGEKRWDQSTKGMDFYGVAGDAGRVFVTLGLGGEAATGSARRGLILGISASSGLKLWEHEMENVRMGEAAAVKDLVFVPWDRQNVSVLDAGSGDEICRIRSKDDVVNFIVSRPEGVYFGAKGLYRFDGRSWTGKKTESTFYEVPVQHVPGNPELLSDKLMPMAGLTTARDKIRFFWQPVLGADPNKIELVDSALYLLYYRFLYAFDAASGQLRWAYRNKMDIEDVQVVPGGLFLFDKKGDLVFLDAGYGQEVSRVSTGMAVLAGHVDVGRYKPAFAPPTGEPPSLRSRLVEIILDNDNRLVPVRKYTLSFLKDIEDPEVTKDLLDVYIKKDIPKEMKDVAREMLLLRNSGAAYLVESMKYHFDYLDEMIPPPMGVVAQALVKMKAKEGVPGLLQHLLDHETPYEDMREVALAILELGDRSIVPTLEDFLIRYHADSAFKDNLDTLVIIVRAIHTHGSEDDRAFLRSVEKDPTTLATLSGAIDKVFKDHEQKLLDEKLAAEKAAAAAKAAAEAPVEGPVEPVGPKAPVPATLTQKQVSQILDKYFPEFAPCIQEYVASNPDTSNIRLKFIITNQGKAEKLMTLPSDPKLSSCLLTKIVKVEFPPIKSLKQNAQYVIFIKKPKGEKEEEWPPVPVPGEEKPPTAELPPEELPPEETPPGEKPPTWLPKPPPPPGGEKPPEEKPPEEKPPGGEYPDQLYPDELPE